QAMQSMERARNLALTNQIAQSNQIRGLLLEFGIILPQGLAVLRKEIPYVLEDAENGLPDKFRAALLRLWEHLLIQIDHVDDLTKQLEKAIKANPLCQKLMKLEGVGPIGALGLALRLGKGENFSNGRNASASI
nr:transposase [Vibrio anguillarum]